MFYIRFILNIIYTYVTLEYNSHFGKISKETKLQVKMKEHMLHCCANGFHYMKTKQIPTSLHNHLLA